MAARKENCSETQQLGEILTTDVSLHKDGTSQEHEIDLVPKDTGWAWMCCLGIIIYCYSFTDFSVVLLHCSSFVDASVLLTDGMTGCCFQTSLNSELLHILDE